MKRIHSKFIKNSRIIWKSLPLILCVLVVLLIILLGVSISHKKTRLAKEKEAAQQSTQSVVSVVTQTIIPITMVDHIDLPAVVEPWEDLTIKTEVVGKVVSVHVKEGDHVRKGQTIVIIDSRDYQNQLQSIAAQHVLAEANFKRLQSLIDKGAVSQAAYDKAIAALNELQASKKNAELNLERCTITAPFKGTVNDLSAKQGMLLAHGDPVAQLLDISKLKVEVSIPESEMDAVRKVDTSKIIFSSLDNYTLYGKKIYLAKKPLTTSLVYALRLEIENPDEQILPGMFARVDIIKNSDTNAFGVPLFTVITRNDEKYVYVVEDTIAHKRIVKTGYLDGWKVQIKSGLQENDKVVIVGHRNLDEGQQVKIIRNVTDPGEISR
jgi:membrane fusion protein (multidrug efflux system)